LPLLDPIADEVVAPLGIHQLRSFACHASASVWHQPHVVANSWGTSKVDRRGPGRLLLRCRKFRQPGSTRRALAMIMQTS